MVGTETSGNYGHAGRPGEVGGSAPGGAAPNPHQNVDGLGEDSYGESNYRGIKLISYDNIGDKDKAFQNAHDIKNALDKAPQKDYEGLKELYVTGGGSWLGSSCYFPEHDSLLLMDGWLSKTSDERERSLLHEIGHRAQFVTRKQDFVDFRTHGLKKYFYDVIDSKYSDNYKPSQHAGETFAQSYALYLCNIKQPEELNQFWRDRL